uniref:Ig-like domain-containing protein n=1 Tax=Meleagris gallopavo TaxID=9103 RepID=A0A803Y0P2_MELGA
MAPMALALILGWWLVAASRAQQLPRPSLSLHPSQEIEVGDNVTLRCHLPRPAAWVWLRQHEGWTIARYSDKEQDTVEFSFLSTNREHAGTYRCKYQVSDSEDVSEMSDPVELVLTDRRYPPPGISLSFEGHVMTAINISIHMERGSNVTIRCWNWEYGSSFLLHKGGHSAPVQRQDPIGGGMATFTLFGVSPTDSGTYSCSYRPRGHPSVSSPLGDSVTLEVTSPPTHPGRSESAMCLSLVSPTGGSVTSSRPQGGGFWGWHHPNIRTAQVPMGNPVGAWLWQWQGAVPLPSPSASSSSSSSSCLPADGGYRQQLALVRKGLNGFIPQRCPKHPLLHCTPSTFPGVPISLSILRKSPSMSLWCPSEFLRNRDRPPFLFLMQVSPSRIPRPMSSR